MTLIPTTEERYEEMLEILPPIAFDGNNFLVGEPFTHRVCSVTGNFSATYDGYCFDGEHYLVTDQDVTRAEFKKLLLKNQEEN